MSEEQERHQPKGSMCLACAKQNNDCSKLDFAKMTVLYRASLMQVIVKCTEFEQKAKS